MSASAPTRLPASLRLPARLESLPRLRELAVGAAVALGLGPEWIGKVDLALEEAVVNIARHAYHPPPSEGGRGDVELSCEEHEGGLRLTLRDWGVAFNPVVAGPLATPDPDLEADLVANLEADLEHRAPGGMGLFLIRSLAKAGYSRQDEANVLTLDFRP